MGKIKTAKRNIVKKRSKRLRGGGGDAGAGAGAGAGAADENKLDYDYLFKKILREYEATLGITAAKVYSIRIDDCSFFETGETIKYKKTILGHTNNDINKLVETTHQKLAEWNKCLEDITDESGGVNNSAITTTKPENFYYVHITMVQ